MKVACLASGGVDSAVSVMILKNLGFTAELFYIKVFMQDSFFSSCPWKEDLNVLQKISRQFNIPLNVVNMEKEYFEKVVKYTIDSVKKGLTPNPDIFCNKFIKFGAFIDNINFNSYDFVSTGHYAVNSNFKIVRNRKDCFSIILNGRVINDAHKITRLDMDTYINSHPRLLTPEDTFKDQTYFLSQISQSQLRKIIFPLGDIKKEEVRCLAEKFNLSNYQRPDSQGICFLGKFQFKDFLKRFIGEKKGDIIDEDSGQIKKAHKGFWYFTIGQREGIGLPQGPFFVTGKDIQKNIVFVSRNKPSLYKRRLTFTLENVLVISQESIENNIYFKIRHEEKMWQGKIFYSDAKKKIRPDSLDHEGRSGEPEKVDLIVGQNYTLVSDEKFYTQASGQFVTLYQLFCINVSSNQEVFKCIGGGRCVSGVSFNQDHIPEHP